MTNCSWLRGGVAAVGLSLMAILASRAQSGTGPGRMERVADFKSRFVKPRHVDVWLPAGYPKPGKRYPVLYMHDGQNLFDPKTSFTGVPWGVDSTLARLSADGVTAECIVVGIWNTDLRFPEYAPAKPIELMHAAQPALKQGMVPQLRSDAYLRFIVEEVKPYVDRQYRTAPGRKTTFISGSSMGGLISLYAVLEYPRVFGGAACLSTHWPLSLAQNSAAFTDAMLRYMHAKLPRTQRPKLYFDYGTATLDASYEPHQLRIDSLMRANGYGEQHWLTRKFEGAAHNEAAWKRRFEVPARFLLGKDRTARK